MRINHIHLETVDSTNSYARRHAAKLTEFTCISAEEQTAGRGRQKKKWFSPRGFNLYATFFFRLPLSTPDLHCLSHLLALSLAQILLGEKLAPQMKPPNDLLLNGKKVAGVLCELTTETTIEVALGIGVNVNMPADLLAQIDQPATSLLVETSHSWDREKLLLQLEQQLLENLEIFEEEGFSPFQSLMDQLSL